MPPSFPNRVRSQAPVGSMRPSPLADRVFSVSASEDELGIAANAFSKSGSLASTGGLDETVTSG